jgi:tetratricopeptide (TPR) repeat protein
MWLPGLIKVFRWRIARLRRQGSEPEKRIRVAAAYVRLRPSDPQGWALWGHLLNKYERYEEAEQVLRRGLAHHPRSNPDIGWVLARALSNRSKFAEARELLLEQAGIFPDNRLPWLGLAEVALRQRHWDEVIAFAENALARTSSINPTGKYEAAILLAPIPAARARAVALLREVVEAVESSPAESMPSLLLGQLLELDGNPEASIYLERARATSKSPVDFEETLRLDREMFRSLDREDM